MRNVRLWSRLGQACVVSAFAVATLTACSGTPELPDTKPADFSFDVGNRPDFASDMKKCLTEDGWDVSVEADGSYKTDNIPNGQRDAYTADQNACAEKFGYNDPLPVLSDEQVREVYQHGLWDWKCLDENGYSPDSPPSEQAFVDGYHNSGSLWTPLGQYTASLSSDDLGKLLRECPRSY